MNKLNWPRIDDIPDLTDHQREVAEISLSGRLGVLAGTPGCGKTFAAAAIIKAIVAQHGAHNVGVCTPTGKAAVRLTADLQKYKVDVEATTIHRLLQVRRLGYDGKGWGFHYGPQNKLPFRFIILDEGSMCGTDISNSLFSAIEPGTHVLIVGDPYQLTPVEHGAPLRDLKAAGVPWGELTEIKRNNGTAVQACKAMKEGRRWESASRINVATGENLQHIEQQQPAHALAAMERIIGNCPQQYDRTWDIQVLCAVNEKTEVSRGNLNARLQAMLNPSGPTTKNGRFRLNDKVICTSNAQMELVPGADDPPGQSAGESVEAGKKYEQGDEIFGKSWGLPKRETIKSRAFIANGDIGRVVYVSEKEMHVRFLFPQRTVKVFVGAGNSKTGDETGNSNSGCDCDLAYAITTHKSQGSSAPIVITMADGSFGAGQICSREWYYTAISRLEIAGFTIGQRSVIDAHCRRVALGVRKTFLVEKLKELVM
ncbi:MAG: AAA family ATPase [Planctomycetota bacterium]|nr:AAA family ATPase [Planctomycetota bacterium]